MNNTIKFFVDRNNSDLRVDIYLSNEIEKLTRSYIQKIIKNNKVKINNEIVNSPSIKVKTGDKIIINLTDQSNQNNIIANNIKLNIIFEDKDILIIDKPKGMIVHPGAGNSESTLANALQYKFKKNLSDINGVLRPGIVHRIDKDTSGLLVVAKNNLSHNFLADQFKKHTIDRKYLCLVWGVIRPLKGRIETLISRNKRNRQLMKVSDINGKKAVTNYKTLKVYNINDIPKISLVECELETGRTHQIRVHLKYKGTSILGDKKYGKKNMKFKKINKKFLNLITILDGQALHAKTLGFIHPTKKKLVRFESKLPLDFKKMLNLLDNLSG